MTANIYVASRPHNIHSYVPQLEVEGRSGNSALSSVNTQYDAAVHMLNQEFPILLEKQPF